MTVVCIHVLDKKGCAVRITVDRRWFVLHSLINPGSLGR
jgi:hypothetical protein